jgi:hypothetical protein
MHQAFSLWFFFFIGMALFAWHRADKAVGSPLNGIVSYGQYLHLNRTPILIRYFIATLGLIYWGQNPHFFTQVSKLLHWDMALDVPLNIVTAGAYGLMSDALLDIVVSRFKFLQNEIPPVGGSITTTKTESAVTTAEATTTKTTVVVPPQTRIIREDIVDTPVTVVPPPQEKP